jgi:hypothetical protein
MCQYAGLILLTFLTRLKVIESRFGFRYGGNLGGLGSWREGFWARE